MFDNVEINIPGGLDFTIPKMVKVKQNFEDHKIEDVGQAVKNEIIKKEIKNSIVSGSSIAIGVGSRGVANIAIAVKALVESLKDLGAKPFIFPAMGSHGGGTVENQIGLLAGYGVTEENVGAEVKGTMETVVPVTLEDGTKVHMDKYASEADGVILINCSRGKLINEKALEYGLKSKKISGLGLDVFNKEPYSGNLSKYNNVLLTPHIATFTKETRMQMELEATNNLIKSFKK